ncbi:MAG: beta-lactamase family protein [Defluviitaleaceae bacterium]|nr:beta-lactamase family protein [Defluviitaleaceae bacterium]
MLTDFRLSVMEKNLGVYGVLVHQNNKLIAKHSFRAENRIHIFSISKTLTSMAVGIAEKEGLLKLEDSVISYFPEFESIAVAGSEKITIRNLLNMVSGHMSVGFTSIEANQNQKEDWAELFFKEPMRGEAGAEESFTYENACTYMLGRIIHKTSGLHLRDYMLPRFFEPLAINFPNWHTCPKGYNIGAFGLFLTTEEISRLGLLMLNGGVYNEKQVVPKDYLKRAITDTVQATWSDPEGSYGYGYQLWRCSIPNTYRADGKYGQYCVVLPDKNAVVTVTSHMEQNQSDILRAIWSDILPKL